nr:hypothetical protein [Bacillus pumilus]
MVNYGSGSKYRVGSYYPATFKGTLKDASGNLMPNQPIQLYFEAKESNHMLKQRQAQQA